MPIGTAIAAGGSLLSAMLGYQTANQTNEANKKMTEDTNRANQYMAWEANQTNREIAEDTNAMNERIAMENLGFQRELQEYQKGIQKKQWEREDTSYQRTAADMLAAGLNPLDMQGTNGAGEVVSLSPLNNSYQAQQSSPMIASRNESFRQANAFDSAMSASSAIASIADAFNQVETGSLNRDVLQADIDRKYLENYIYAREHGIVNYGHSDYDRISSSDLSENKNFGVESSNKQAKAFEAWSDYSWKQRERSHMINANKYDSDTDFERILTAISDWINNGRGYEEYKKLQETFPILKGFNFK